LFKKHDVGHTSSAVPGSSTSTLDGVVAPPSQ
jgi:hypothetical protein